MLRLPAWHAGCNGEQSDQVPAVQPWMCSMRVEQGAPMSAWMHKGVLVFLVCVPSQGSRVG